MEQWVKIKDLPDGYFISNWGQIKIPTGEIILGTFINRGGYRVFRLVDTLYYVHVLVLENFTQRPFWAECGNHKNGVKADNRLSNLEWSTYFLNNKHARDKRLNTNVKWRTLKAKKFDELLQ